MHPFPGPASARGFPITLLAIICCCLVAGAVAWSADGHATGTLHIVWEQDLPPYPSGPAMDVRWASDRTVFLAWVKEGITETALDGKFTRLRSLIPDPGRKMRDFEILAVSGDFIVSSARFRTMAFRTLGSSNLASRQHTNDAHIPGQENRLFIIKRVPVGIVEDLDLSGNRLLLLGSPDRSLSPKGAVAWIGPVTESPGTDLKPLQLYDVAGARSPSLVNCSELELGGVRFLPDGSFLVVPGFQPGAYLFNSRGQIIRTWKTQALGLDAVDCAHVSTEQLVQLGRSQPARFAFLNQHRVLEDILPLQDGPGLLIRWIADGKVHWELKVLQSSTRVLTYQIPFTGELPYDRLRGDVRGNRIVLLLGAHGFDRWGPPFRANRVVVAELPQLTPQTGGQP